MYNKNTPIQPYGSFVLGTNLPDFATIFPNNRYSVTGDRDGFAQSDDCFGSDLRPESQLH